MANNIEGAAVHLDLTDKAASYIRNPTTNQIEKAGGQVLTLSDSNFLEYRVRINCTQDPQSCLANMGGELCGARTLMELGEKGFCKDEETAEPKKEDPLEKIITCGWSPLGKSMRGQIIIPNEHMPS